MLASKPAPVPLSRSHHGLRRLRAAPVAPSQRTRRSLRSKSDAFKSASSSNEATTSASTSSPTPSTSASASAIAATKASILQASPAARKGDPDAIAAVVAAVDKLAALSLEGALSSSPSPSSPSPRFPAPPEPSTWETLYTDAKVGSNGKFGPLQGEARQLFLLSSREKGSSRFVNRVAFPTVSLPLLQADFSGSWLPKPKREDRLEVIFEDNAFYVFGIRVGGGVFPAPPQKGSVKGHWVMKFADEDLRAFVTNKMSLVVLGRVRKEE